MKSSMSMSMSLENVMALMEGNPKFSSTLENLKTAKHNLDIVERFETKFTNNGIEGLKAVKKILRDSNLDTSFLIFDEEDLRNELVIKRESFNKVKKDIEDLDSKILLIREDRTISEIEKEARIKKVNADKFELHKKSAFIDLAVNTLKTKLKAFKEVIVDGDYLTKMFNDNKKLIEEQFNGLDEETRINIETEMFRVGRFVSSINEKKTFRFEIEAKIKELIGSVGLHIDDTKVKTVNEPSVEVNKQAEIEANKQAEIEVNKQAEIEVNKQVEIEVKRQTEIEAKRQAEIEAKRQAEIEAKRQAEIEAKRQAEIEAKRQAEIEAKRQAEIEAKRQAEIEAKRQAEIEANRQPGVESQRVSRVEPERSAEVETEHKSKIESNKKYKVTKIRKAILNPFVGTCLAGGAIGSVLLGATSVAMYIPFAIGGGVAGMVAAVAAESLVHGLKFLTLKGMNKLNEKLMNNINNIDPDLSNTPTEKITSIMAGFKQIKEAMKMSEFSKVSESKNVNPNLAVENPSINENLSRPVLALNGDVAPAFEPDLFGEMLDDEKDLYTPFSPSVQEKSKEPYFGREKELSKSEIDDLILKYSEQGKELPEELKSRVYKDSLDEYNLLFESLDDEVAAKMGGR